MGYPNKGNSYPDLISGMSMAKTDGDKLKLIAEQLKSIFATKMDLKDKNLEREIRNFLILNVQDYIKKAPGLDSINNKLIKYLKAAFLKFLDFFFNLCINFGIHPQIGK